MAGFGTLEFEKIEKAMDERDIIGLRNIEITEAKVKGGNQTTVGKTLSYVWNTNADENHYQITLRAQEKGEEPKHKDCIFNITKSDQRATLKCGSASYYFDFADFDLKKSPTRSSTARSPNNRPIRVMLD